MSESNTQHEKLEKVDEMRNQITNEIMVPEGQNDGLSSDFHDQLDAAQDILTRAVEAERSKQE